MAEFEEKAKAAEEAAETTEPMAESAAEPAAEEPKKAKKAPKKDAALKEEIEKLKAQLEEEKKQHLYLVAEYENYRRRSQKEKDAVYTDAVSDIIGDVLPVLDNLSRAAQYQESQQVAEGLALISKSANALLGKYGVEEFGKAGDAFDPNLHNAVMHEENEEFGENTVCEVFQTGYRKGDRIIRFAMVKVAN